MQPNKQNERIRTHQRKLIKNSYSKLYVCKTKTTMSNKIQAYGMIRLDLQRITRQIPHPYDTYY